jgi:predicted Rdx family selenoprotein
MAGEALGRADGHIASYKLTPGPHGKFDVVVDGQVIAEHRHESNAHIFPDLQDLMKVINTRVG